MPRDLGFGAGISFGYPGRVLGPSLDDWFCHFHDHVADHDGVHGNVDGGCGK